MLMETDSMFALVVKGHPPPPIPTLIFTTGFVTVTSIVQSDTEYLKGLLSTYFCFVLIFLYVVQDLESKVDNTPLAHDQRPWEVVDDSF